MLSSLLLLDIQSFSKHAMACIRYHRTTQNSFALFLKILGTTDFLLFDFPKCHRIGIMCIKPFQIVFFSLSNKHLLLFLPCALWLNLFYCCILFIYRSSSYLLLGLDNDRQLQTSIFSFLCTNVCN